MSIRNQDNLFNPRTNAAIGAGEDDTSIGSDFNYLLYSVNSSIPPHPFQFRKNISLKNGKTIRIRLIRGGDEAALKRFFEKLSEKTVYLRFGQHQINLSHDYLVRLCHLDYDLDLTFIAMIDEDGKTIIGDARLNRLTDLETAELSFVVADQWQGKGVGDLLMEFCVSVARDIGLKTLLMEVMNNNERMMRLGYKYGFQQLPADEENNIAELELKICRAAGNDLMTRNRTKEKIVIINSQTKDERRSILC
jgi:GNAT superfamily N-acetyltransferase